MSKLKNDQVSRWWRTRRGEIIFGVIMAIVIVLMLIAMRLSAEYSDNVRTNAPCEYFASRDIENVPARCYHYFSIATPVEKLR
jgi:hypothetical protein